MRIFWYQGGLQVQPENESEGRALVELVENLKIGKPPEMQNRTSGSGVASSGEELLKAFVGDAHTNPSSFSGKTRNQQRVVPIHKLP